MGFHSVPNISRTLYNNVGAISEYEQTCDVLYSAEDDSPSAEALKMLWV
jgi:hypothetical protein